MLSALGAAVLLLLAVASIDPSVLCVLPALSLVGFLAVRRYPGEKALLALGSRRREGPPRGIASGLTRPRRWIGPVVPRGGLLLACSLANRPPPLALHAAL